MAEGFISQQACICGCDTLMPQHLVNRGWQYLRGHKPAHLRVGNGIRMAAAKTASPVVECGFDRTLEMARENQRTLSARAIELEGEIDAAEALVAQLKDALAKVDESTQKNARVIAALEAFLGAPTAEVSA